MAQDARTCQTQATSAHEAKQTRRAITNLAAPELRLLYRTARKVGGDAAHCTLEASQQRKGCHCLRCGFEAARWRLSTASLQRRVNSQAGRNYWRVRKQTRVAAGRTPNFNAVHRDNRCSGLFVCFKLDEPIAFARHVALIKNQLELQDGAEPLE